MNPQQRGVVERKQRRQTAEDDQACAAWRDDIAEIEAARIFRLEILAGPEAAELLVAAVGGDRISRAIIAAAERGFKRLRRSGAGECGACLRRLPGADFTMCVMIPEMPDPTVAVCFGLCRACSSTGTRGAALTAARNLWPDLRPLEICAGGRA